MEQCHRKPLLVGKRLETAYIISLDNDNGAEKFCILLIWNGKEPRCFNEKSSVELGFGYKTSKKAWMTG